MNTATSSWMTFTRWLLLLGLVPVFLHAQETAAAASGGDVSLGQLWAQGGWALYPLAFFSVAGFGLILYNALSVREQALLRPEVSAQLQTSLDRGDVETAREVCAENPCLVANITAAGLVRVKEIETYDAEAVEKAMEEASVEEIAGPFGVISYLSILATLAPMVGMLGTVSGMIKAFRNIALGGGWGNRSCWPIIYRKR
ncbi:MAG: MotA/TolQ/ExbB proton channel family protein [Candidatus Synoicihabitans palmerolidicus]|nr:MotA/TolQ/ExbB proton channel family protein [Candidatus Synoicihabitans palmerolidicus]